MQNLSGPHLPVDECIPELLTALGGGSRAVLVAPPGAGKTTRVPLAVAGSAWCSGKVIVLEPRRLAARASAAFVASSLADTVGAQIGYRVRLDSRVSPQTRIEFVTEGVFARMIADDPELTGVSAVIFDEYHERNLDADLGLALALDTQAGLRRELRILVMSATLQGNLVADFIGGAALVESQGRGFPVDIHYSPRPVHEPLPESMARAVGAALAGRRGSILCFLPGQADIIRTSRLLEDRLPPDVDLHQLYGSLDTGSQDAAIRPAHSGRRKVVLATAIAETSLTIDGVGVVIDSGLRREPRYDPGSGLTRLETVRAARSSVDQRAGRAGRTAPGVAIRLWHEAQTASLRQSERPEILDADLSGLVLALAEWGVTDPTALRWMTPPPQASWAAASSLLRDLGATDAAGGITAHGRAVRTMPLPPVLAHLVVLAARRGQAYEAAALAMLLSERGVGGKSCDLASRLERLASDRSNRAKAIDAAARRIAREIPKGNQRKVGIGGLVSLAYPERIARSRGHAGRFLLANGRGAHIDEQDTLAHAEFLVAAELRGSADSALILSAAEITGAEIDALHAARISTARELEFDDGSGQFRARMRRRLGSLVLSHSVVPLERSDRVTEALCTLVRDRGISVLPWDRKCLSLRNRLAFLHRYEPDRWPAVDDTSLADTLQDWLVPFLDTPRGPSDVAPAAIGDGLRYLATICGGTMRDMDRLAPDSYSTPAGTSLGIDYRDDVAVLPVRVQEMFGTSSQPTVMDGRLPLTLELLSPAMRPIQVTNDIEGFWKGSWQDVRREMRGRYPKHTWPENPANAAPTRRTARKSR